MPVKSVITLLSIILILPASTILSGQDSLTIFEDDYESFIPGQQLVCQDSINWDTWSSIPCDLTEDPFVTNTIAYSGLNSVWIQQNNDLIKPIPHCTSGKYSIRFKLFIPSDYMASWGQLASFISPDSTEWGFYAKFNPSGNGIIHGGGWSTAQFSFPYDVWMDNELIVDLNSDWAEYYFGGNLVYGWQWTLGSGGDTCSLQLAVTDLMGNNWPDPGPSQWYLDDYIIVRLDTTVGVIDDYVLNEFQLEQNYPNPFNPSTKIRYQVPGISFVTLKVYAVLGNEIAILVNEEKTIGSYEIEFNAAALPSGVYFYQLKAGSYMSSKKMILLR